MALVLDTGVVVAALTRDDKHHERCRALLDGSDELLVIPAPTLSEIDYWVSMDRGPQVMLSLLRDVESGAYLVEDLKFEDYGRVRTLLEVYADLDLGFVDAAVLAIVERLREPKLATLDHRHFAVVRPRHVDALELLPS